MEIGNRLLKASRACDRVARYAGDEFLLMINDIPSRQVAEQIRHNIEELLREPLQTVDVSSLPEAVLMSGSVGMAFYPDDGDNADELIKRSDHDMFERKRTWQSDCI